MSEPDDNDGNDNELEDDLDEYEEEPPALPGFTRHAIAAALCDGAWERGAMERRLVEAIEPHSVRDDAAASAGSANHRGDRGGPDGRAAALGAHHEVAALELANQGDEHSDVAVTRRWFASIADEAFTAFESAPPLDDLAAWLLSRSRELPRLRIVRFATPAPEMRESPWPVPALATLRELAVWLGLSIDALASFARERPDTQVPTALDDRDVRDRAYRHYRYRWLAKPSGGMRLLEAPKPRLRAVQRDLLDGIIAHVEPHAAAFAFRAGRSVVDLAAQHAGRDTVIRLDLSSFFTSVLAPRVAGILRMAGYPDGVARCIAAICTHRTPADVVAHAPVHADRARLRAPHLPQGAPTSGALANLAAYRLDVRIAALAAKVGATYGRYADDLVLSGDRTLAKKAPSLVARIGAIAMDEGFALNLRKTRVMTAADQQRIAGIVVNARPAMAREELERLRAILTNCVRTGPAAQNRDGVADFRAHLRGRVAWVAQLDPAKGERLRAIFDRIRWDARADAPA